jgi:hypothetical protein
MALRPQPGDTQANGRAAATDPEDVYPRGMGAESLYSMAVGDPRRPAVGRAAFGTLLASAVFLGFTATKQIKPIFFHAPWINDPYDTVFSFTMFFVPLVAACLLVQVALCRRSEPLPAGRVISILRACRVAVVAIVAELATAWIAVAVGANRSSWTGVPTGVLIGLLALSTVVTCKVIIDLGRAPRLRKPDAPTDGQPSDWLADLLAVARGECRRLGSFRRPALTALDWADRTGARRVRLHPAGSAAVVSGLFAVTVLGWQAVREGYSLSAALLAIGLGFCGMFAFLVLAGSYLGIVRSPNRLQGSRRRALDATVVGCTVAIATVAFHDQLWWVIGSSPRIAGTHQFATLVGTFALLAFCLIFTIETVLGYHPEERGWTGPGRDLEGS